MSTQSQTRRIARPLAYLATAALIALPVILCWFALAGSFDIDFLHDAYDVPFPEVLPAASWVAIYAIAIVSVLLAMLVLWNVRALFSLYATDNALSMDAALCIRRIGTLLLVVAIYGVVADTLTILALTATNPPGERQLSLMASNTDLFAFLAAGLMTVIGHAMSEAARIAAENRAFV